MKLFKICALTFITAATLTACTHEEKKGEAAAPLRIHTALATSGPAMPPISTSGVVVTKDEMRLSFKVGGVIRKIHVQAGDKVEKGQRLAEIEPTEVNAQVEQVREIASKARRDLERGERLYADQVIPLEQLEALRTQAAVQNAQLEGARFNQGYSVITAPGDGVVLRKLAEEQELSPPGQPVLIVGSGDSGYIVRLSLADREVVQLKPGDSADVHLDAFPGETFQGTITEIASAADERTGLFPVEAKLASAPVQLINGLVAKVSLQPSAGSTTQLTYVPIAAIVEGSGESASVYVIKGNRAERRDVKIARAERRDVKIAFIAPTAIALADGVKPGEQVVTDGALYLRNGDAVEIVQDTAPPAV